MTLKLLITTVGLLSLTACQPSSSKLSALGIQDCGGNPWNLKFCPRTGDLKIEGPTEQTRALGAFQFSLKNIAGDAQITVTHPRSLQGPVLATLPGKSFLAVGVGSEKVTETRGSFTLSDKVETYCTQQTLTEVVHAEGLITLKGRFEKSSCPFAFEVDLRAAAENKLDFTIRMSRLDSNPSQPNRIYFTTAALPQESFLGFGMQFSQVDMKGKRLPILAQEQGVGRGLQPVSIGAEVTKGKGVSGSWFSSYGAVPHFLTNRLRSLFLKNSEYMVFDFADADQIRLEVFASEMNGQYLVGASPEQLISAYTDYTGRMDPLPQWMDNGVIVGMQGGTTKVKQAAEDLQKHKIPTSAFWLQDWVGKRTTTFGSQLWWNWQLDRKTYPEWEQMVAGLKADDIRVLTYVNPFLVDTTENPDATGNLFKEAVAQDLLVKNEAGEPYAIENSSFSAGLLDLSKPETRSWAKAFIRREMIATGVSGWMADFGEALPFDSILSRESAAHFHNLYPESWAELNQEVLKEDGLWDDFVYFSRSAFTRSPGKTRLFWLGDQLVSWDNKDGMRTALTGLITSGLSGFSLNHSDIGGYTTITNPLANYHRSKELFLRWTEMNAFTAVMRTHEGNMPEANHQWNSDEETMQHFARFATVFRNLAPYRRKLMLEAQSHGLPLVRHLFIHYPTDPKVLTIDDEFLLGADMLIAPVLDPGANARKVYLPSSGWVHYFTGKTYAQGWHEVEAPIGLPPVFYRESSLDLALIRPKAIIPTK